MFKWFIDMFKRKEEFDLWGSTFRTQEEADLIEKQFEVFNTIENAWTRRCRVRVKYWKNGDMV